MRKKMVKDWANEIVIYQNRRPSHVDRRQNHFVGEWVSHESAKILLHESCPIHFTRLCMQYEIPRPRTDLNSEYDGQATGPEVECAFQLHLYTFDQGAHLYSLLLTYMSTASCSPWSGLSSFRSLPPATAATGSRYIPRTSVETSMRDFISSALSHCFPVPSMEFFAKIVGRQHSSPQWPLHASLAKS